MIKFLIQFRIFKYVENDLKKINESTKQYEIVSVVPPEIDTHFQLYGKHMWEVVYEDECPVCEKKIDEFGYCACNACSG